MQLAINPISRRNHLTLLVSAALLGFITFIAIAQQWPSMLIISLSLGLIISLATGLGKWLSPEVSMTISEKGIRYHHRRGTLLLSWQRCQRIDQVRWQGENLNYIGIRLRQPKRPLNGLTPRVALSLLGEYRHLTVIASNQQLTNTLLLIDAGRGGVLAAFKRQQALFRKELGYDLLLPYGSFDRPPEDMLPLLKKLWGNALSFTPNNAKPSAAQPQPE